MSEQILFNDWGTTYNKCKLWRNNQYTDRVILQNKVYEITQKDVEALQRSFKDSTLETGIFTERYIDNHGLSAHANEISVQEGAVADNKYKLEVAYRNMIEHLEAEFDVSILDDPSQWKIASAIALLDQADAGTKLAEMHKEIILDKIGFGGVYIRNRPHFDIVGNLKTLETYMTSPFTACVVNVGGGDSKVVCVSKEPVPETVKRTPFGGRTIIEEARAFVYALTSKPVRETSEIQEWLIKYGDAWGNAEPRTEDWRGKTLEIEGLLNTVEMLFATSKFPATNGKQSLTEIVIDSLEAAHTKGKEKFMRHAAHCILLTGGGSLWRGVAERLKVELEQYFPDLEGEINIIRSPDPQYSTLNGMINVHTTLKEKNREIPWETR